MMISLPNATQFPLGRKQPKSTREKGTQYKDATTRNKFAQTVSVITYNTISIQTMTHHCTCLESRKKDNISKSRITRTE